MNKAFEKILEFIDEQIKIEESIAKSKNEGRPITHQYGANCMDVIKKFVHEVAEEYKCGWIACSEMLPEEYTVLCCDKYGEMIVGHPYFDEVSDTNYSAESDGEMMYNCVAWQPLPEPYKEGE